MVEGVGRVVEGRGGRGEGEGCRREAQVWRSVWRLGWG